MAFKCVGKLAAVIIRKNIKRGMVIKLHSSTVQFTRMRETGPGRSRAASGEIGDREICPTLRNCTQDMKKAACGRTIVTELKRGVRIGCPVVKIDSMTTHVVMETLKPSNEWSTNSPACELTFNRLACLPSMLSMRGYP